MSARSCLLLRGAGGGLSGLASNNGINSSSSISSAGAGVATSASSLISSSISSSSVVGRRGFINLTSIRRMTGNNFNNRQTSAANVITGNNCIATPGTGGVNVNQVRDMSSNNNNRVLTIDNIFENLVKLEYAVRGPLLLRAIEIENELKKGAKKPFKEVIKANIGDAHAMGQQPITFIRQVCALAINPSLFNDPSIPDDAKQRARGILDHCKGQSVGAYTESPGIDIIRKHVAKYIEERDGGIPSNWENIILSNGATEGIKAFLKMFNERLDGKPSGVMIPIPQYPLYSATLSEFGLAKNPYYLNEENKWSLDIPELERAYDEAKRNTNPRVLVVINPGNPTGQVLSRENIEDVIKFAYKHKLFLLADEVYQDNIYDKSCCFHSFKKVMTEMGDPYCKMELVSFMSISKGYMGECGLRGGYSEYVNVDPQVMAILNKSISASLCSTTIGQTAMECVVNPPRPGEPSYEQFKKERDGILSSLAERSRLVVDTINSIPGYFANPAMGAMYVFPKIDIPDKAKKAAKAAGQEPDVFYAFRLLEATGICVIPGSGFGQKPGTYHYRTTILPQVERMKSMMATLKNFHEQFLKEFS